MSHSAAADEKIYLLKPLCSVAAVRTPHAILGVLCAMPQFPRASSTIMPPWPCNRLSRYSIAVLAAISVGVPACTLSAAHLASTSFIMGSPHPVHETAALKLSA